MEMTLRLPSTYVDIDRDEMEYVDGGGFVGFYVHIPQSIVDLGSVLGGAAVGGFVGWYCKPLAEIGPWGAAAVAAIMAGAGGIAGFAISKGLRVIKIGVNIPFVSWNKHIYM